MAKLMKQILIAILTISVLGLVSASAFAAPTQQEIDQYKEMLKTQAEADSKNVSAADRAMAKKWLKEAEVLLANGEDEAATRRLQRVEFALDLIRAMVAASEIRAAAEQQEAEANKGPERTNELKKEIQQLQKRLGDLQRELQTLR